MPSTPTPTSSPPPIQLYQPADRVPLVVNLEVKAQGRVEHLANFAYNQLRNPLLTTAITSVFWIVIIIFLLRRKR